MGPPTEPAAVGNVLVTREPVAVGDVMVAREPAAVGAAPAVSVDNSNFLS